MTEIEVTKKLLLNQSCVNCNAGKDKYKNNCLRYLGEGIGKQWWPIAKEGTCEDWQEIRK